MTLPAPTVPPRRRAASDLVVRAREGDARAWAELVAHHQPLLWWLARRHRLSTEDAADAVQLTWLRCLEHLDQLADTEALAGWLATICRRECLRIVNRRRGEILLDQLDGPDSDPVALLGPGPALDPYEVVARRDEGARLREAIGHLPARPRQVLTALLADDEGDGYAGVAERLGIPIGSLGPTRSRALARLRQDPRLLEARG